MRLTPDPEPRAARPQVLLLSPHNSFRLAPYLQAAREIGVDPWVISDSRLGLSDPRAHGIEVDFHDLDQARDRILRQIDRDSVAAVIGTDDATVEIAAQLAARLGLRHNPPLAVRRARRKDLARACLAQAGLRVPHFRVLALEQVLRAAAPDIPYPCVVKPVSLSGSRGVIRADTPAQFTAAVQRIAAILAQEKLPAEEAGQVLVEDYVPGPEFAFEGLLNRGHLHRLALFDKPDPMEGPYFEETYYITPSRLDAAQQEQIERAVQAACAAYGLCEGPVHAEMRLHAGEVWFMEMAARTIGGQCARLLQFGTGYRLEQLVLLNAADLPYATSAEAQAAGVLMLPIVQGGILRRVEGVLEAMQVPGIEDLEISLREGYELVPLPEGDTYLGFLFARAATPDAVEQALREAYAKIRVVTAPLLAQSKINPPPTSCAAEG